MFAFNCNKSLGANVSVMGFNLNISSHKNLTNGKNEHAISLSPNIAFSSKIIKDKSLHIVFNIDSSGSMMSGVTHGDINIKPRIELTKECVKEAIMFLYTMVTEGKDVYISVITFSSSSKTIIKHKQLLSNQDCLDVMKLIDGIKAYGPTNIGSAIVETIDICNELNVDKTYKILISDGYITTGVVGVPQIKQDYKGFYSACIGIGNELHYDKNLLQTLSEEFEERACYNSSEMKEQIIDSVYSNVSKIAEEVVFSEPKFIIDRIKTDKDDRVIQKDIKFTTKLFWIINSDKSVITIKNVPMSYLKSGGYNVEGGPVVGSFNNIHIGDIMVNMCESEEKGYSNIEFHLELSVKDDYKSKSMEKSFRKIQKFIEITNEIMEIDIDNISSLCDNYKKNKSIYDRIIYLIKYINECDANDINSYLIGVLDKFKVSIEPYTTQTVGDYILNPPIATPLRMARTQTSSGSYAFVGRQVSMGYSMGIQDYMSSPEDNVVNSPTEPPSPVVLPAPTLNIPMSPLHGFNNMGSMGAFNFPVTPPPPSPELTHS